MLGRRRRTEALSLKHERSSVGARPSSAAPVVQNYLEVPRPIPLTCGSELRFNYGVVLLDGAAGDGRAPTEELSCVRGWCFCSTARPRKVALLQTRPFLLDLSSDML